MSLLLTPHDRVLNQYQPLATTPLTLEQQKEIFYLTLTECQLGETAYDGMVRLRELLAEAGIEVKADPKKFHTTKLRDKVYDNNKKFPKYWTGLVTTKEKKLYCEEMVGYTLPLFLYESFLRYAERNQLDDCLTWLARLAVSVLSVTPADTVWAWDRAWRVFQRTLEFYTLTPGFHTFYKGQIRRLLTLLAYHDRGVSAATKHCGMQVIITSTSPTEFADLVTKKLGNYTVVSRRYYAYSCDFFYDEQAQASYVGGWQDGKPIDPLIHQNEVLNYLRLRKLKALLA